MAKVNKVQMIRNATGLNSGSGSGNNSPVVSPEHMALASGPDNTPATITDQQGNPQGQAMIKEGEIIFSVEAVIGAGQGDYDKGARILQALQEQLRQHGHELMQQGTIAGAS